jgi:hypothetical protein
MFLKRVEEKRGRGEEKRIGISCNFAVNGATKHTHLN